jgi:hypothetical protein
MPVISAVQEAEEGGYETKLKKYMKQNGQGVWLKW